MFENASELIIYSGHLLQLWDLNSVQQLTPDDDDNVRVEQKPSKVDDDDDDDDDGDDDDDDDEDDDDNELSRSPPKLIPNDTLPG